MEEINDVEALEKISSEVDESQIKVILSNQCIKGEIQLSISCVVSPIKEMKCSY